MSTKKELREKIDKWFDAHCDDMINDLGKLVGIKSVRGEKIPGAPYGKNSRDVLTLAQSMLQERDLNVSVFEDMMITADYGPTPPLLGILAHLDIVEAGEGWDTDPLKLAVKDGKIYGRGVMDNKGPAVAAMYALYCARDICPQFKHGVQILLGSGEETGFDDITEYLKKNDPPPNVFTPDAEFPVVNVEKGRFMPVFGAKWEKDTNLPRVISITGGKTPNIVPEQTEAVIEGFTLKDVEAFCSEYTNKTGVALTVASNDNILTITAKGTAAHASMPERGKNAQTAMIEMLAAMPFAKSKGYEYICALNRLFPHGDCHGSALGLDRNDDKSGRMTVNFGVIRLSELEFSGNFDSRTPICADEINIVEKTRTALEHESIKMTYHDIKKSHCTQEETPFVHSLLCIYEEYTGKPGKCISMGGLTYAHDIPGGVAFGCVMPDEDNRAHGSNEFISVEQLIMSAKMFTLAIIDMCVDAIL